MDGRKESGISGGAGDIEKDASAVKRMVSHVFEQLIEPAITQADYGTAEFCRVFGEARLVQERTDCLCPANVDLILDNIFPDGEQNYIIDGEWIFDFPIPSSFVIWRTINELYANCPWFEKAACEGLFMGEYGITSDMEEVFFGAGQRTLLKSMWGQTVWQPMRCLRWEYAWRRYGPEGLKSAIWTVHSILTLERDFRRRSH